jgi:hypothetical protein
MAQGRVLVIIKYPEPILNLTEKAQIHIENELFLRFVG